MKNLFSYDLTARPYSTTLDEVPFITARISPELADAMEQNAQKAFDVIDTPSSGSQKTSSPHRSWNWKLVVGLLLLIPSLLLPLLALKGRLFEESGSAWAVVSLILLMVSAVLIRLAARDQRKQWQTSSRVSPDFDLEAHMKQMKEFSDRAFRELGVPRDALSLDVLPYRYRRNGTTSKSCDKANHYDNQPMLAWRRGQNLCFSDGRVVITIPCDAVAGRMTYDQSFTIKMWLKPTKYDQGPYKKYHITSAGLMACRARTYYGLVIQKSGEEAYEIRIPAYDWMQIEKMVDVKEYEPQGSRA